MELIFPSVPVPSVRSAKAKRILVVDDHPIFRKGVVAVISAEEGMEVCGEAADADEALALVKQGGVDAAILDISLPGKNGIELIKMIKAEQPSILILMLSMHSDTLYAVRSLKAGARGYIPKAESATHLISGLRQVLAGKLFLSPRLGEKLILRAIQSFETDQESPLQCLTRRELEIVRLLGEGLDSREIAGRLKLSIKTVETHRGHAKEKLCCSDAGELVKFASEWRAYENESLLRDDAEVAAIGS